VLARRFNRDVLELWFSVADYGEHFGRKLARYYAVRASDKRRNFTPRPGSDLVREDAKLFVRRPALARDRLRCSSVTSSSAALRRRSAAIA
jgi:hypothetical protein